MRIVSRGFGVSDGRVVMRGFYSSFIPNQARAIPVGGRSRALNASARSRTLTAGSRGRSLNVSNKVTD